MNIEIWTIGKQNDAFIEQGVNFYLQRIKPYCSIKMVILPPPKRSENTPIEQTKLLEEKLILEKLTPHHFLVLLDENGKSLSSRKWAQELQQIMNSGTKTLVLLIGGAWGVTQKIKEKANKQWSLSQLTFPHQMVRLMVAEQVYRGFSILHNSPYHHD